MKTASNEKTQYVPTLGKCVDRMKREILADSEAGIVPQECSSFSELHEAVDANCYGGFCEDAIADALMEHFGGPGEADGMPDALTGSLGFMNAAQEAVDLWIKDGGILLGRTED